MYILFNKDGSIKEKQLEDYVNQHSDGVNHIDIAIEGMSPEDYSTSAKFKLPIMGGDIVSLTPLVNNYIETDSGTYSGYRVTLTKAVTEYPGSSFVSVSCYTGTSDSPTVLFTYPVSITINETTGTGDNAITEDQYNALMAKFTDYQLKFGVSNTRCYASLDLAVSDKTKLADGQYVLVGDVSNVEVYKYDKTSDEFVMQSVADGGNRDKYLYKVGGKTNVQEVEGAVGFSYGDGGTITKEGYFGMKIDGNGYPYFEVSSKYWNVRDVVLKLTKDTLEVSEEGNKRIYVASDGTLLYSDGLTDPMVSLKAGVMGLRGSSISLNTAYLILPKATYDTGAITAWQFIPDVFNVQAKTVIQPPEGNGNSFYTDGAVTYIKDPADKQQILLEANKGTLNGVFEVSQDPTTEMGVASKGYVDVAIAKHGADFHLENGKGTGAVQTAEAEAEASGEYSFAFGYDSHALGDYSFVFGEGVNNSYDHSFTIGEAYTASSGDMLSVGKNQVRLFAVGENEVAVKSSKFTVETSENRFDGDTTFKGDVTIDGTLTAGKFVAIDAKTITTDNYTVGLAKGNTSPILTYIGLYATKYDGTNDGALVWDNTGTAYVGDVQVDSTGKVTDPNNTLQPLLTRAETSALYEGCILSWSADSLKAVKSPWFSVSDTSISMGGTASDYGVTVTSTRIHIGNKALYSGIIIDDDGVSIEEEPTNDAGVANKKYVDEHSGSPIILRQW